MSINRQQLTKIIESDNGNNWWKPDLFENVTRSKLPKELEIISPPPQEEDNYNCFVFAFGLKDDLEFLGGDNPIQQEFVKHLIRMNILLPTNDPLSGDFVFYENNSGKITHGGILESTDQVVSKWMWGPIIRHKLWDVPSSFGEVELFFKPLDSSKVKEEYNKYKASGVKIKPIT